MLKQSGFLLGIHIRIYQKGKRLKEGVSEGETVTR